MRNLVACLLLVCLTVCCATSEGDYASYRAAAELNAIARWVNTIVVVLSGTVHRDNQCF